MAEPRDACGPDLFPRGLAQPENGYRFSLDSLLLAAFVRASPRSRGLDLGAGCGVAGLGVLLRGGPNLRMTAVDQDPDMASLAEENAARLGLSGRFRSLPLDLRDWPASPLAAETFDFALANPPYHDPASGRVCPDAGQAAARFELAGTLADFVRAAALAVKTRGRFFTVLPAERFPDLVRTLSAAGFEPKRVRFVHSRADGPARLVLTEAVRAGKPGLAVDSPLVLSRGRGRATSLTAEALAFCPFLGCNPGPNAKEQP